MPEPKKKKAKKSSNAKPDLFSLSFERPKPTKINNSIAKAMDVLKKEIPDIEYNFRDVLTRYEGFRDAKKD